jgi:predicted nucleic acid-binding protein
MTPLVLVDTSGWICYFARKGYEDAKKAIATLLDEDRAATCGPILIELVQGARNQKEKEMIKQYFQGVHWLPVHDDHWHEAADLAYELRRKGITPSAIDALIATLAVDYQCILLHKDSDFERISKHSPLRTFPL